MSTSSESGNAASATPTRLILIRHGETEANVQRRWYGAMDAPLTKRGQVQVASVAGAMAELVQRFPPDVFYVSPLPRAQTTAAAIAEAIDMQPQVEGGLREFQHPRRGRLAYQQITFRLATHPDLKLVMLLSGAGE